MKRIHWIATLIILLMACHTQPKKIKVACVGDSITEGYGIIPESALSYPAVLANLLDDRYTVLNFGRSGCTVQKQGNLPYWNANEFSNVFAFKPNVIVLTLGTNDTKPVNWNEDRFIKDYQAMIDTFNTISSHPIIFLCQPPPVFRDNYSISDSTLINGVLPAVNQLAKQNSLPVLDLYSDLKDQATNFPDGVHPYAEAAHKMAVIVADAFRGKVEVE